MTTPLNNLETPLSEKDRSASSADDLGAKLVRRAVDSGIDHLTEDQLVTMRTHLEAKPDLARVRAVCDPDRIADLVTDELWTILGREPSAEEYRELADVLRDAAVLCKKQGEANR